MPHAISCFKHKFGLNTFAVCRADHRRDLHHETFTETFLAETVDAGRRTLDTDQIETDRPPASPRSASGAAGCSSSAWAARPGHASHAVNDFRKICGFEAYAPTDNVSELTARTNDEGWDTTFAAWLRRLAARRATTPCWCSPSAAATPRRTSRPTSCAALELAKERGAGDLRHRRPRRRRTRPSSPTPASIVPAALRRPHHPAHRGAVRRGVAPAGHPPGAGPRARPSGSPSYDATGGLRRERLLHRRRRRASSAATSSRRLLGRPGDVERVTVYDNFSSGRRLAPRRRSRDDPRLDGRRAATSATCADADRGAARPRRGHPPRLQPRHRGGGRQPGHRLRPGHRCSPTTSSRRRGTAGSGWCSTPRAAASTATSASSRRPRTTARWSRRRPTAPASSPARRCSRRTPRCSTSPPAPSGSATSSARSQTHGVGFDFVRRLLDDPTRLRILGDGQQSKSYIHVERRHRGRAAGRRAGASTPFDAFNVATGDYVTVTEIAELAMRGARARARARRRSSTPAATAAGRATCRSCGSRPSKIRGAGLGQPAHRPGGAARLDDR